MFTTYSHLFYDLFMTCSLFLLTLLPLNYFTLFTSLEVLHFSHLQSSDFIKINKLNGLAGLSLAQISPSLFLFSLQLESWPKTEHFIHCGLHPPTTTTHQNQSLFQVLFHYLIWCFIAYRISSSLLKQPIKGGVALQTDRPDPSAPVKKKMFW